MDPTNPDIILVADGGSSQQVKAFNSAGTSLGLMGWLAAIQTNGVAVATNKFWFYDGEADGTFLCFAPDGSFWVGDGGESLAPCISRPQQLSGANHVSTAFVHGLRGPE